MVPNVIAQLVAGNGVAALHAAIGDPDRFVVEPKVDGVRGLVTFAPGRVLETRNRHGVRRDWLRRDTFETGLRQLALRIPILWDGTVLDGELTTGRFATTPRSHHDGEAFLYWSEDAKQTAMSPS